MNECYVTVTPKAHESIQSLPTTLTIHDSTSLYPHPHDVHFVSLISWFWLYKQKRSSFVLYAHVKKRTKRFVVSKSAVSGSRVGRAACSRRPTTRVFDGRNGHGHGHGHGNDARTTTIIRVWRRNDGVYDHPSGTRRKRRHCDAAGGVVHDDAGDADGEERKEEDDDAERDCGDF
jgi:hypothetical protein